MVHVGGAATIVSFGGGPATHAPSPAPRPVHTSRMPSLPPFVSTAWLVAERMFSASWLPVSIGRNSVTEDRTTLTTFPKS